MPKTFGVSFNGYKKSEVDEFLASVTKEYQKMLEKVKKLDAENKKLQTEVDTYKQIESSLRRTLALAEESNQSIRKSAKEESISIIEDANKNASRIVNDALIKARKITDDASSMKREVLSYRNRVKSLLDEEDKLLDKYDDLEY